MAHAYAAHGTRQTTVFTAIIGLHIGVFIVIMLGLVPREIPAPIADPPPIWVERPKPPPPPEGPVMKGPADGPVTVVTQPDFPIPKFPDPVDTTGVADPVPVVTGASAGSGPVDYQRASLSTRDQRIAAAVAACYPAASRRLDEEGRAVARVVLDAQGKVVSWSLLSSSGFARLDAALGCVLKHLEFDPARRDGRAVAATVDLPIVFRLN